MKNSRYIFFALAAFFCWPAACFSQSLPVKPSRMISFTTDEGSYMNVDISPDGRTIVFDLLGDLYTVPSTGGEALQLTRGLSLDLNPCWSPDGKKIAYISDYSGSFHVNIRDISGTLHLIAGSQLKDYDRPILWLAGSEYLKYGRMIYGTLGGSYSLNRIDPLRFSADGYFTYYLDSSKIFRLDKRDSSRVAIAGIEKKIRNLSVSPDGRYWAGISGSGSLLLHNCKDNQDRVLVETAIRHMPEDDNPPHFSFSLDSRFIFIGYGGKIHKINMETGENDIIPFTAHVKSDLGPLLYNTFSLSYDSVQSKYIRSAQKNPDGKQIVFEALSKIYLKSLRGGKPYLLASQPFSQYQPVYSPDGNWIAYVSWCDTAGGFLWRVPSRGGMPEQMTKEPGKYQYPCWSPDGKSIAVIKGEPILDNRDSSVVMLVPVNGDAIKLIDKDAISPNRISFSKDGARIIYRPPFSWIKNQLPPQLVSRKLDGTDEQVFAVGDYILTLQQRTVSPDGKYIVYRADEDLFLVPVCDQKKEQVLYDSKQNLSLIRFARGADPNWEKNGQLISWTHGSRFYELRTAKIIEAAEKYLRGKQIETRFRDSSFITVNVQPDAMVNLDIKVPASYGHGTIVLRNVRILTMNKGKVIERGTVVIKDGRFAAIGENNKFVIPGNARVYDLPGATIVPGLIDLHDHVFPPASIFPQQHWSFLANLAYGVTTARDPSVDFDSYGYGELLRSGQMIGPRYFTAGTPSNPSYLMRYNSPDDFRALVQKRKESGGLFVKQYTLPTRLQRQWLLLACRQAGLNMTNEGSSLPVMELAMIKDGNTGVEHSPFWGDVYKDVTTFFALSGSYLTPTLQVGYGNKGTKEYFKYKYWHGADKKMMRYIYSDSSQEGPTAYEPESVETILKAGPQDTLARSGFIYASKVLAQIRALGGRVTLGSHGNDEGIGAQNELWALQAGGLTNMQALEAATIMGAEALGLQKDLGSIEVGKVADLVILNRNPLDDIHNSRDIRYVMKDGILYDGDSLDECWPVQRKCPEWKLKVK